VSEPFGGAGSSEEPHAANGAATKAESEEAGNQPVGGDQFHVHASFDYGMRACC
jgi:hypothetical protein